MQAGTGDQASSLGLLSAWTTCFRSASPTAVSPRRLQAKIHEQKDRHGSVNVFSFTSLKRLFRYFSVKYYYLIFFPFYS